MVPASPRLRATPLPTPRLAPVTTATFPCSDQLIGILLAVYKSCADYLSRRTGEYPGNWRVEGELVTITLFISRKLLVAGGPTASSFSPLTRTRNEKPHDL